MASPAQIAANRLNSQKSTGPSPAGLAKTPFNALKTGIDAQSLLIPGEDPAALEALSAAYQLQFLPASPVEQFLVDTLVHADWKLRRLRAREAQLSTPAPGEPLDENLLDRLDRRIHAAQRLWFRALKEVQRQIPARIGQELAEIEAARSAGECADPASPAPAPPPEIGFVPPPAPSAPAPPPKPVVVAPPAAPPNPSKPQKPTHWDNPALRL